MDMASMQRELKRLRAEVAALTAARDQQEPNPSAEGEQDSSEPQRTVSSASESGEDSGLKHRFDELIDILEKELRDLPTITCLAVFSLGIILGRHLR